MLNRDGIFKNVRCYSLNVQDVTLVCDDDKQIGAHKKFKSISSTSILIECVRCGK